MSGASRALNRHQLRRLRKVTGLKDLDLDMLRAVMVRRAMREVDPAVADEMDADPANAAVVAADARLAASKARLQW